MVCVDGSIRTVLPGGGDGDGEGDGEGEGEGDPGGVGVGVTTGVGVAATHVVTEAPTVETWSALP